MPKKLILAFPFLLSVPAAPAAPVAPATVNPCPPAKEARLLRVGPGRPFPRIPDALAQARAGDRVLVGAGTYSGGIELPRGGASGRCLVLEGEPGAKIRGGNFGISINGLSHIAIRGFDIGEIREGAMPTGIRVQGAASHIELRKNLVHDVRNTSSAHAISFYGNSETPMRQLLIVENELRDCQLGSSETLVLNGNVDGFEIRGNRVHDNDNIGIDIIGHEGQGPAGQDFARNGLIVANTVFNISSGRNPHYKGERSAGGIYVDGGREVRIEGNTVRDSDIGIELASEHAGESTEGMIVRDNTLSGSYQGNLMLGGYDAERGRAVRVLIEGNRLSRANGNVGDDRNPSIAGELIIQHNSSDILIRSNSFETLPGRKNIAATGENNSGIRVQGNRYATPPVPGSGDLAEGD